MIDAAVAALRDDLTVRGMRATEHVFLQVELNALLAMVDSLDAEALTETQSDLVAALRDRLRSLAPSTDTQLEQTLKYSM